MGTENPGKLIDELREQVRDPKNRLEVHGLVFRMNGFPIFFDRDEDSGELVQEGEINEAAWDWEKDLGAEDRTYFWLMVGAYQAGIQKSGNGEDKAYWTHPHIMKVMLEEYGIKCWHYSLHRRPIGSPIPPFECLVCGEIVMPDRPLTEHERAVFDARHDLNTPVFHIVEPL